MHRFDKTAIALNYRQKQSELKQVGTIITKMPADWKSRRVPRQVPKPQISSEETRRIESKAFYQRCQAIFDRVRPE